MADVKFDKTGVTVGDTFLSWDALESMRNMFRFEDHVLVKVSFSYGRSSDLYDHWLLPKTKWDNIHACLTGRSAYYSDFAGKHSEVELNFWDTVGLEIVDDFTAISEFHGQNGWSSGNMEIIMGALEQLCDNGELELTEDGTYNVVES